MGAPEAGRDRVTVRSRGDVYRFIDRTDLTSRAMRLLLFATLTSFFVDGYDLVGIGIGFGSLQRQFHLTPVALGLVASSALWGALGAALVGGYFVDRIGRLKMFMLDVVFFVVSAVVAALAPSVTVLLVARFLMGVGIGLDVPAAFTLIAEYCSLNSRRRVANNYLVYIYYATIIAYILAIAFYAGGAGDSLWRWIVGFAAIPSAVILLLRYLYMNESPFWQASHGDLQGAARALERVFGVQVSVEAPAGPTLRQRALGYASIFTRPYLARTVATGTINVMQSVEFFAIGFYLPVISAALFPKSFLIALVAAGSFQVFGLLGSGASALTVQRVGLRRQTLLGFGAQVILLAGIGLLGHGLPAVAAWLVLGIFLVAHTFGPGQNGVTMAALSYPTEIRGQGSGFSFGIGRAGAVVGSLTFPILLAGMGLFPTLLVLGLIPLVGFVIVLAIRWDPVGAEADGADAAEPAVPGAVIS